MTPPHDRFIRCQPGTGLRCPTVVLPRDRQHSRADVVLAGIGLDRTVREPSLDGTRQLVAVRGSVAADLHPLCAVPPLDPSEYLEPASNRLRVTSGVGAAAKPGKVAGR